ncbi:23S rRNA (guanosine(2251)-2'-O)-methyltransferase RlmB [Phaeovibrio sulfidiphilus]|uniref:23S rRNA (Guanosine(2251)-2'-O)-methyltransferase RlmB n=1 Tax=Phaeovibrio sulfidiphilus TaxID=1220600 RepID=A0A8J6YKU9_9PROT|nr:23S rRNA (guanosine(2251)-2'-O)-methyltransferase RlmB [Phaeovibrio sulfidiphilus]MBE1236313.1 23S rRNA (guanosine(2251)-2'-O)-methyltransferase RlmB [Phaeovibrio sulfidiphilus]
MRKPVRRRSPDTPAAAEPPARPHGEARGKPRPGRESAGASAPAQPPGTFWLFGRHAVEAALANPKRTCLRLNGTPEALEGLRNPRPELKPEPVTRMDLDLRLPPGAIHQGLALLVRPLRSWSVEDVAALEGPAVVVMLDQVSDPHNVGAIWRSAAAFGVKAVIVQDRNSPDETGVLARSACGALERVPAVRASNLSRALDTLKEGGFWCAGLEARGETLLSEAKLGERIVVVLGAEGSGLRRLVREHCDVLVRLPMSGDMESLNVSNAAAITFYDLFCRR